MNRAERIEKTCKELEESMNELCKEYIGTDVKRNENALVQSIMKHLTGIMPSMKLTDLKVRQKEDNPGVVEVELPREIVVLYTKGEEVGNE